MTAEPTYFIGQAYAVVEIACGADVLTPHDFETAMMMPLAGLATIMQKRERNGKTARGYFEVLLAEIIDNIDASNVPTHASLEQQGAFGLGYYHRKNELNTNVITLDAVMKDLAVNRQRVYALAKEGAIIKTDGGYYSPSITHYKTRRGDKKGGRYPKQADTSGERS